MDAHAHRPHRGIHYTSDTALVWRRRGRGTGFEYLDESGKPLSANEVERIQHLVIPPAWSDVRIAPDEKSHIQAVGFDAKGRKQYIYHPDWLAYNQQHKFDSMVRFGEVLPVLRAQVAADMRQHTLNQTRMIATIVWLLEHTFIRIGNVEYQKENDSYGLTTLREKHVSVKGNTVTLSFRGKSGVHHEYDISHPRIAQTIKQCIELPGYELFRYMSDAGTRDVVDSRDVNEYLQQVTGESMTAKDFRTWGGTTMAGESLYTLGTGPEPHSTEDALIQTVKHVSEHLGNTTTVCRKYYIHPKVLSSYEANMLVPHFQEVYKKYRRTQPTAFSPSEQATWTLIQMGK